MQVVSGQQHKKRKKKKPRYGQAMLTFSRPRSHTKWPTVVASLMLRPYKIILLAYCRDNSTPICLPLPAHGDLASSPRSLKGAWAYNVIYRHAKFECRDINCYYSTNTFFLLRFRRSYDLEWRVKVIGLRKDYIDLSSDYLHSKRDGHFLQSFWNTRTYIIYTI